MGSSINDQQVSLNTTETDNGYASCDYYYCLVGNIPKSFHASDLRNYFAAFVEDKRFKCFHFRHRPQVITVNNVSIELGGKESSIKEVLCCIVQFGDESMRQAFVKKYKGLYWMDKEGNGLQGRCVIQQVKMSEDELKRFSKELSPPNMMPNGNVGTPTQHFRDLIKQCRLPPSIIKKLGLEFPLGRRYKAFSKVPFDYGTEIVYDQSYEEEVATGKGHAIPDVFIPSTKFRDTPNIRKLKRSEDENCSEDDDDRCEDWERHEALHEDVTEQERLKERLYEEEMEVLWEKGGPGIVWHTDAFYWQSQEGGFDEQTSDDWDVDMEGYYVPGGGDKDARDCLEMRKSERFQKGLEDVSVFRKKSPLERTAKASIVPKKFSAGPITGIGKFETYTKGVGRMLMERCGWKDGDGLGRRKEGIKDALFNDGQGPMDKRGIGYYGEKLSFGSGQRSGEGSKTDHFKLTQRDSEELSKYRIGTIFDNPLDLDKPEPTLRSNDNKFPLKTLPAMSSDADIYSVRIQSLLNLPPCRNTGDNVVDSRIEADQVHSALPLEKRSMPPAPQSRPISSEQRQSEGTHNAYNSARGRRNRHEAPASQQRPNQMGTVRQNTHNLSLMGGPPPALMLRNGSGPTVLHRPPFAQMSTTNNQAQYQQSIEHAKVPLIIQPRSNGVLNHGQGTRNFDCSNGTNQQRTRPPKPSSHLLEQLRNEFCPKSFVAMKDKLIAASIEEQKPMQHLNLDEEVLWLFGIHCIEPLAKKSTKFVRAKYFCHICNYHMDNITNIISHVSNARHEANAKTNDLEMDIKAIPFPSSNHVANLGFFISTVFKNQGIDDFERSLRRGVLDKLNHELSVYDMRLELFGSSVSGFGFKSSDINLNLNLTSHQNEVTGEPLTSTDLSAKVAKLSKILETFSFVKDVTEGHHSLEIKFRDAQVDRLCSIQVNNVGGVMLAQLFEEYNKLDERVKYLVVAFRYWARLTGVDDQDLGYLPGHSFAVMALKHLTDVGVIPYIILPETTEPYRTFYKRENTHFMFWNSESRESLGSLWLGLLRKYSLEFPFKDLVISLVTKNLPKTEDKIWNRKIAIEDPIRPRANLTRTSSSSKVFDYIMHALKLAFKYFGTPKLKGGVTLFEKVISFRFIREPSKIYFFGESGPEQSVGPDRFQLIYREQFNEHEIPEGFQGEPVNIPKIRFIKLCDYTGSNMKVHIIAEDLPLLDRTFNSGDYYFEFDRNICQGGEGPPMHCRSCGKDDHVKPDCPEEVVPPVTPVPSPDDRTLQILDAVMRRVYDMMCLTPECNEDRKCLVQDIHHCLVRQFTDVELLLFGSTSNGFGLRGSDVDVSVRFTEHAVEKAAFHAPETAELLKKMTQVLRSSGCMQEIFAIPTAKVPIIKFKHKRTHLEGDISLYNALPLRNTELLRSYSNIDPRIKVLVCFLKQLTKICDIGDASKGSLSSYAYVLMLIHFLQQLSVPVLPVLQEIPAANKPERTYDGWDTYFFPNLDHLSEYWEHFGVNNQSVSSLLLGFIKYYTEVFKYEEHVITINQLAPLHRKDAHFPTSTLICIEDPFEKCHNLGAGLTRRMSVFIIKTFQRFRHIFSRPIPDFSPEINYIPFYLDSKLVRGEFNPPVDRQCRICNKIGHFANTCNFRPSEEDGQEDEGDGYQDEESATNGPESPVLSPKEDVNQLQFELGGNLRRSDDGAIHGHVQSVGTNRTIPPLQHSRPLGETFRGVNYR